MFMKEKLPISQSTALTVIVITSDIESAVITIK
jgi:hypothetical protein